jgi:hypothetical protein
MYVSASLDVLDCERPSLSCPAPFTAECTAAGGATVTPPPASASDNYAVAVHAPAAGSFPLGTATLSYTATDPSANTANRMTTVTVQDTAQPSLTCPSTIVAECMHHGEGFVGLGASGASSIAASGAAASTAPGSASGRAAPPTLRSALDQVDTTEIERARRPPDWLAIAKPSW